MAIPLKILERLRYGKEVAVEVAVAEPNMRAFILVIPQVPNEREEPDAYIYRGENARPYILRDPSLITGYEIRWLKHDVKYNKIDGNYDFDPDDVLENKTTRVKRLFIEREEDIEKALAPWVTDMNYLRDPLYFDSSLVGEWFTGYLDRPEELPHLWQED